MTTKEQLTAQKRGKGGTLVRLTVDPLTIPAIRNALDGTFGMNSDRQSSLPKHDLRRDVYVVSDLANRKTWNKPDEIAVSPMDLGVAFAVPLSAVEIVPPIADQIAGLNRDDLVELYGDDMADALIAGR